MIPGACTRTRLSASTAGPRREYTIVRTRLALVAVVVLTACGTANTQSSSDGCDPANCVTLPGETIDPGRDARPLDAAQTVVTEDTFPTANVRGLVVSDTVPTVPADTVPTTTVSYSVSNVSVPSSVTAGDTITFEWTVTDPEGAESPNARVGGPSGWVTWCPFPMLGTRISGDELSGTYRATCDVPANAPNTTYTVFFLSAHSSDYDAQRDFVVTGGSTDTGAPTISELSAPATASLGDSITVIWRAADPSGVKYSIVWFANGGFASNNGVSVVDYGDYGVTRLSGDEYDGVYSQTVRFRDDSPIGTYTLWVSRADLPGNKVFDDTPVRITVSS